MKPRTSLMARGALVASAAVLSTLGVTSVTTAAPPAPNLKSRLLTVSDLPTGWRSHRSTATFVDLAATSCLRGLSVNAAPREKQTASFVQGSGQGSGLPALGESLAIGVTAAKFDKGVDALASCHSLTLTVGTKQVKAKLVKGPVLVPGSHAFSLSLTVTHVPIGADIVVFRAHVLAGEIVYLAIGAPTLLTAKAFAQAAVSKAQGHPVPQPPTVSIVSSPVRVVNTQTGTVGYREVGSGPPLVMVMGFAGTMETWDPRFVDALAHSYKVIVFDNLGIGESQALSAPLTIDKMADQLSALIRALGLEQPDVLGWSMGSMVAEALAVLHPTQVQRLVLCAAYPGTGTVEPTQKTIAALTKGTPTAALADLFPVNQRDAATAYEVSLADWPTSPWCVRLGGRGPRAGDHHVVGRHRPCGPEMGRDHGPDGHSRRRLRSPRSPGERPQIAAADLRRRAQSLSRRGARLLVPGRVRRRVQDRVVPRGLS